MGRLILYSLLLSAMTWGGTIIFEDHLINAALDPTPVSQSSPEGQLAETPAAPPTEEELSHRAGTWLRAAVDPLSVSGELLEFFPPPLLKSPPPAQAATEPTPSTELIATQQQQQQRQADLVRSLQVTAIVKVQGSFQAIIGGIAYSAGDYVYDAGGAPVALVEAIDVDAVHLSPIASDGESIY